MAEHLFTKTGDGGFASTMNRRQIAKNAPIFAALGTLDELNAALGMARNKLSGDMDVIVEALQTDLIAFSGELAGGSKFPAGDRVNAMEQSIDMMMESTGRFEGFVTPGATAAGAALDFARTVARRAERELVSNKQTGGVGRDAMMYMNRLSDLLYALARLADAKAPKARTENAPGMGTATVTAAEAGNGTVPAQPSSGSFMELGLWLCRQVLEKAKSQGLAVVTACCDAGGNLVSLLRDDGAYIASIDVAQNKAYTSVALQMPTENLAELCGPGGSLYGLQHTNQNRIVIFGGGVPLRHNGVLIGGFGVSGGTTEQDTFLARYAHDTFSNRKV